MINILKLNPIEEVVRKLLIQDGFLVMKLPESSTQKTCDFWVKDDQVEYFVEVKAKFDDEDILHEIRKYGSYLRWKRRGRTGTISSIVHKANRQIDSSIKHKDNFHVCWIYIDPKCDGDFVFDQIKYTLYGIEEILATDDKGHPDDRECFFFTSADFRRYIQLDGVVVHNQRGLILLVNNFSQRYEKFTKSKIYQIYHNHGALVEPCKLEKAKQCYIVDIDGTREDKRAILEYIKKKYNLIQVQNVILKRLSFSVGVSTENKRNH